MFSPEACGLRLLCDAIGTETPNLECDETFESPKRKKKRKPNAHVSFCDTPCVREYEVQPDLSLWSLVLSSDYSPVVVGDDEVDRRLAEADLNCMRNRQASRYGTPSPVTQSKRHDAFDARARREEGDALSRSSRPLASTEAVFSSAEGAQRVCDPGSRRGAN